MRLNDLISATDIMAGTAEQMKATGPLDVEIAGLAADSRRVHPGFLFAALPGSEADGRDYVPAALKAGASALLLPEGSRLAVPPEITVLTTPNPRRALALMAARFAGAQPKIIVAVTGTSGKTSTTVFARQLWTLLGHRAGSMGTIGVVAPGYERGESLTTPDPIELHAILAELARKDVDHVAIEASSHGLDQYRLDGVQLAAAAFTNLSRDHLDYHPTMGAYLAAKLRLFSELLPSGATAVVNADIEPAARVVEIAVRRKQRLMRFGRKGCEIKLLKQVPDGTGQTLELSVLGVRHTVTFPVVGLFQAENLLAALGLVIGSGADPEKAVGMIDRLTGVHGRIEHVATTPSGASIYVDYAHKPGGLEAVLTALRPHADGRLVALFGCGGDRDPGKRPQMGEIATRLADRVIVTDDNPRTEDPAAIRAAVLKGAPGATEIGDRAQAIKSAIRDLRHGDLLVIAGKGHETYQIVGKTKHPFDDSAVARAAVAELGGGR
ncbi:MAG TPA: UDP-N-acetylmuramoyl-L-alanyl-D-glutamate--2,6-diaminopimelate ligase [Dongiaceae bacterium]|nr:UDP-N-acetylmuramoyl-L-alanyl-D-glutamate--2,6-diaminopimelate ligase [Dongiaceae bacterium]